MNARKESSRPKILLVVSSYAPNFGGLQSVTSTLAAELQERGHDVTVITHRYPRTLAAKEILNGVRVQRWLFLMPRMRDISKGRLDLFLAGLFYFPTTLWRLFWYLAHEKPQVVNLHFLGAPALFTMLARQVFEFRFVVSLHGDDVEGLSRGTWFDRWIFRSTLRRADYVTACSWYLLDRARQVEPSVEENSRAIHNGADLPDPWPGTCTDDYVLALGRMVPKKGFDVLLRAMARSGEVDCLKLIGDGPERRNLETLARELGLDGRVHFLGSVTRERLLETVACSRMVVIPSRQEPFGMVALEAMSAGRPVVATCAGGLPEVLDGADAALVEPDDPAALAEAIAQVSQRVAREPAFGRQNRTLAARFSTQRMVSEYLAIYA